MYVSNCLLELYFSIDYSDSTIHFAIDDSFLFGRHRSNAFPTERELSPKSIPCEFAHFNIYMSQSNIYFVSLARSAISLSPSLSLRLLHIFFLSLSLILHFHYYRSSLFHLLCRWCSSSLYSNKSISSLLLSFNLDHRPNLIVNSIPSFN